MFGGFFMKFYSNKKLKLFDKKILKSFIIGVLCAIASIILLTLLFTLILTISGTYPANAVKYISLVILAAGVFVGGYFSAKINKSNGLVLGIITGFAVFIVLLIIGLCQSSQTISLFTLYKLLISLVFSAVGGVIGVNKQNKIKI